MDSVTIAAADAAQLELVARLAQRIWRQHYPGILSAAQIDYMLDRGYRREALWRFVSERDAGIALARKHGEAVGFAAWYRSHSIEPDPPPTKPEVATINPEAPAIKPEAATINSEAPAMKLDKLYVMPAHHKAGIGRLLIEHVVTRAREAGCASVRLNVNRENAVAIRAYERCGFVIRARGDFPIGNGFVMEDFIMVRDL